LHLAEGQEFKESFMEEKDLPMMYIQSTTIPVPWTTQDLVAPHTLLHLFLENRAEAR